MSSELKPRSTSTSSSTHQTSISSMSNNNNNNDNEKELKIRQHQQAKFRQFLCLFVLLAVIAFLVGRSQQQSSSSISPNLVSRPHVVRLNNQNQQNNENNDSSSSSSLLDTQKHISELEARVRDLDSQVRAHKALPNMIMETDPTGMKLTKELQHVTHQLLVARYGNTPKRVVVDVVFPPTIPDYTEETKYDQFVIEMAPHELIPCSVFYFLEMARTWKNGSVHRNAGHVLQIQSHSTLVHQSMPFQEYSPEFPHKQWTTGYAGRPSGPGWYISIIDNTGNHGPGTQQQHNPYEADSNFGKIVKGITDVIPRIHSIPQNGWLDKDHQIQLPKLTIMTPKYKDDGSIETWVPWVDTTAGTTTTTTE